MPRSLRNGASQRRGLVHGLKMDEGVWFCTILQNRVRGLGLSRKQEGKKCRREITFVVDHELNLGGGPRLVEERKPSTEEGGGGVVKEREELGKSGQILGAWMDAE